MKGLVTIACGPAKYKQWAKALAQSLMLHDPSIPRHLITDRNDEGLFKYFNSQTILAPEIDGFDAKLRLFELSPFDETVFVDADSIVLRSLDQIFKVCSDYSVAVIGDKRTTGWWYCDIKALLTQIDRPWLPKFNSGLIYFKRNLTSEMVFRDARLVLEEYGEYDFTDPYGRRNDEPCFAVALARAGMAPIPDDGSLMRTPIGMIGKLVCDPIIGYCRFNSEGTYVEPAVVHFVSRTKHRDYARIRFRLSLQHRGVPDRILAVPMSLLGSWAWSLFGRLGLISR